jgi:hypothetical protein
MYFRNSGVVIPTISAKDFSAVLHTSASRLVRAKHLHSELDK